MNKFKKFCQKPLFITAISMVAFFIVAIIVMICIPHGKVYKLSYEIDGTKFNYEITLGNKYKSKHTYTLNGETHNVGAIDGKEYDYEVIDGELFLLDGGVSNQKVKIGDIDSRKIILEYNILGEDVNSKLTCKVNNVLTIIFVVGLYFSIAILTFSAVMIALAKKHKLNENASKTKTEEKLETEKQVEEVAEEKVEEQDEPAERNEENTKDETK